MEFVPILDPQSSLQTMEDENNTIIRWPCYPCRNNTVEQLPGNEILCTQPGECFSPKQVKDFVSSVTEKRVTLKEIELTNVVIFLSPLDRIFYKKLSSITNFFTPVRLSNLEVLKLSISTPKNKRYKKIFKLLLFFIQEKPKLNRLWEVSSRLQTVDLKCGNETIIKFDKTTKELVVGRFAFISPDEYLLHANTSENGLLKFACFKNRVTLKAIALHKNTLTELILNICEIPNVGEISKLFHGFEKLQTLIFDCANSDFTIDIENLLKAPQLKVLVIGHCKVIFSQRYNAMKNQLNGKHVTFFNCVIEDMDLLQAGNAEISIDETGKKSKPVKTPWNLKEILKHPDKKYPTLKNGRHYFELFRMGTFSTYENRYFRITSSEKLSSSPSLNPICSTNPIPPPTNPYTPSTELGKLLATKLKNVVNDLDRRNQYKGIPLKEVFQGCFTDLDVNTSIPDGLVTLPKDMPVLDDGSPRKIMVTECPNQIQMSSQPNSRELNTIKERLTTVTLKEFVREHYRYLYDHTCIPEVFGRELLRLKIIKDQNQLEQCMNLPGLYGKNSEFYQRIIEADDCEGYINALQATENSGILKFLKEKLLPNNC